MPQLRLRGPAGGSMGSQKSDWRETTDSDVADDRKKAIASPVDEISMGGALKELNARSDVIARRNATSVEDHRAMRRGRVDTKYGK